MNWQRGDKRIQVGERELILRLTVGALAEMCDRLGVRDTKALAEILSRPDAKTLSLCAACLLRPVHGEGAVALSRAIPAPRIADRIAELFEEAFA